MSLAEQIAREHPPQKVSSRGYVMCAACAQVFTLDDYALHIATVTERAVVDRLEALARELDALTITHQAENYATVLRIKREGVMEAIRRVSEDADD
jgi:ABC-type transport system involved in cytochrome bd biosynthesis fused ATPase/permease subunit